ncbi:hypothetical protein PR048_029172 [Dryococelus australis]|uniref:Uncharacterized protein n=1 Tax=Dryococelus australis TaxID=614101 RepID=A0ABQ9GCL7_9NEOP|nr:hypothetical protein PR048_029172 [Dryococelus australis]
MKKKQQADETPCVRELESCTLEKAGTHTQSPGKPSSECETDVDKAARAQFWEWFMSSIAPEVSQDGYCAVSSRRIISVFFHEIVNSARYIEHIFNVFAGQLTEDERNNAYLQQDGATAHSARGVVCTPASRSLTATSSTYSRYFVVTLDCISSVPRYLTHMSHGASLKGFILYITFSAWTASWIMVLCNAIALDPNQGSSGASMGLPITAAMAFHSNMIQPAGHTLYGQSKLNNKPITKRQPNENHRMTSNCGLNDVHDKKDRGYEQKGENPFTSTLVYGLSNRWEQFAISVFARAAAKEPSAYGSVQREHVTKTRLDVNNAGELEKLRSQRRRTAYFAARYEITCIKQEKFIANFPQAIFSIWVETEQRRNEKEGYREYQRENPLTNRRVSHVSDMPISGRPHGESIPVGVCGGRMVPTTQSRPPISLQALFLKIAHRDRCERVFGVGRTESCRYRYLIGAVLAAAGRGSGTWAKWRDGHGCPTWTWSKERRNYERTGTVVEHTRTPPLTCVNRLEHLVLALRKWRRDNWGPGCVCARAMLVREKKRGGGANISYLLVGGAVVSDRLVCSPPTKAKRVQSPAGPLPDCGMWESCPGRCRWSAGFLGDIPVSFALAFLRYPVPASSTLETPLRAGQTYLYSNCLLGVRVEALICVSAVACTPGLLGCAHLLSERRLSMSHITACCLTTQALQLALLPLRASFSRDRLAWETFTKNKHTDVTLVKEKTSTLREVILVYNNIRMLNLRHRTPMRWRDVEQRENLRVTPTREWRQPGIESGSLRCGASSLAAMQPRPHQNS